MSKNIRVFNVRKIVQDGHHVTESKIYLYMLKGIHIFYKHAKYEQKLLIRFGAINIKVKTLRMAEVMRFISTR